MNKDNTSWITRRKLPTRVADIIEAESYKVPWYFFKDCALSLDVIKRDNLDMNPYFSHSLSQGKQLSEHHRFFPLDFV